VPVAEQVLGAQSGLAFAVLTFFDLRLFFFIALDFGS
jgi:hypothetical protein